MRTSRLAVCCIVAIGSATLMPALYSAIALTPEQAFAASRPPPRPARRRSDLDPSQAAAKPPSAPIRTPRRDTAYSLAVTPAKPIRALLSYEITLPQAMPAEWVVYVAQPPKLTGQLTVKVTLVPPAASAEDLSSLHRPLWMMRIPAARLAQPNRLTVRATYDATLMARQLVPRQSAARPAAALLEAERRSALAATQLFDHQSDQFQGWLRDNRLVPGPRETQIEFARRVFLTIKRDFSYDYRPRMDRTASHVCAARRSDCGGLGIVFVSALRAYNMPARLLVGRWATSAIPGQEVGGLLHYQTHAKAEFFADGVGWVPVDLSSAVLHDRSPGGLRYFGRDTGDFLTMHLDHDLRLDTVHFGEQTVEWLQGVVYWVSGSGSLSGSTVTEQWVVR